MIVTVGQARCGVAIEFMCTGGMIQVVANISSPRTIGNLGNQVTVELRVNITFG